MVTCMSPFAPRIYRSGMRARVSFTRASTRACASALMRFVRLSHFPAISRLERRAVLPRQVVHMITIWPPWYNPSATALKRRVARQTIEDTFVEPKRGLAELRAARPQTRLLVDQVWLARYTLEQRDLPVLAGSPAMKATIPQPASLSRPPPCRRTLFSRRPLRSQDLAFKGDLPCVRSFRSSPH